MGDSTRSPPPATVIFTMRLWQEPLDAEKKEWRGEVKNLSTNEVRYFRQWDEIASLVVKMLREESESSKSWHK